MQNLKLTSLKVRRERGDRIRLHKKVSVMNKVNWVDDYERDAQRRGNRKDKYE